MKSTLETFDSITGWTKTGSALIHGLNDHADYISGNLSNSLVLYFGATNDTCKKTFSSPVSTAGFREVVLSVYSTSKGAYQYNN